MPVLLIIDMLNSFLVQWDSDARTALIENANALARHFRAKGWPVIWVRQDFKADLSDAFLEMRDNGIFLNIEGTEEAEIAEGLDVAAHDLVLVKKRYSAFFGTNLDEILADCNASELVLAGINSHACIRMAAIDAYQHDIRVVLARDAISSYDEEHERVTLRYLSGKIARIMMIDEIVAAGDGPIWSSY
jgi:maleamate amidohydrolase